MTNAEGKIRNDGDWYCTVYRTPLVACAVVNCMMLTTGPTENTNQLSLTADVRQTLIHINKLCPSVDILSPT